MKSNQTMRMLHRYLGFFLIGIMAVYAISGIVLIFRDSDTFKNVEEVTIVLPEGTKLDQLGKALNMKRLKVERVEGEVAFFKGGTYNTKTRTATYTKKELPFMLEKMTHLHKAKSSQPLFFLNIFFGLSLLFFVISAFWMYLPSTTVFKKGMLFTLGGAILTLVLLFL